MVKNVAYWERRPKSQKIFAQGEYYDEESGEKRAINCIIHSTLESFSVSDDIIPDVSQLKIGHCLPVPLDTAAIIADAATDFYEGIRQDILDILQSFGRSIDVRPEHEDDALITVISPATTPIGTCFVNWVDVGLSPYYEIGRVEHMDQGEIRTQISGPTIMFRGNGVFIRENTSFIKGNNMVRIPSDEFDNLYETVKDAPYLMWNLIESLCDTFPFPKEMPMREEPKRTLYPGDDEKRDSIPAVINRGCLMWFSHTVRALTPEEMDQRRELHLPLGNIECWMGLRALKNSISCSVNNDSLYLYDEGFERTVERSIAIAIYDAYRACFHEIVGIINSMLASHSEPQDEIEPRAGECYWVLDAITTEENCFKAIKVKSVSARGGLCFLKGFEVYCDMKTIRANKTQTLMTRAAKLNPISEKAFTNLFDLANDRIIRINEMMANARN